MVRAGTKGRAVFHVLVGCTANGQNTAEGEYDFDCTATAFPLRAGSLLDNSIVSSHQSSASARTRRCYETRYAYPTTDSWLKQAPSQYKRVTGVVTLNPQLHTGRSHEAFSGYCVAMFV